MKSQKDGCGYNERLFSGGLRAKLHLARFHWFQDELQRLSAAHSSVLELGCFDGKLIDFLPEVPERYRGFDANWEGGLDQAKARWGARENISFVQASRPTEMQFDDDEKFTVAVSMETLEHIPPEDVDDYLSLLAQHLNGYLFVTVPNEKGLMFLAKWLVKSLLSKDAGKYTFPEVLNATLGRMERVARNEHKGFDYAVLRQQISRHFDVVKVAGLPFQFLPCPLSFGIGIIAKSK